MSLRQLLQEHSQNISQNIAHASDIASENAERKANTLEERFQHVKDSIESAGGDLAAIGGAYHMGRKIYKRVQDARKAAQAIRGSGTTPDENLKIDLPEGSESGASQSGKPQTGGQEQADPEAHTTEDSTPAGEQSGESEPVSEAQQEAPESGGGGSEAPETIQDSDKIISSRGSDIEDVREPVKPDEPTGDLGRNIASDDSEPTQIAKTSKIANEGADVGADEAGDEVGSVAARTGASDLGDGTSALVVNNADTASQAASKLAGVGGDALSAGLDTASAVLDALGPVGEVAGIVTSLVGLFEGLGHKKKEVEEDDGASAEQPVSAAIDPTALSDTKTE